MEKVAHIASQNYWQARHSSYLLSLLAGCAIAVIGLPFFGSGTTASARWIERLRQ